MIYVHVPFCRSFCTYCDFYSEICPRAGQQQVQSRYLDSLLAEISHRRRELSLENCLTSSGPSHCKQWAPPSNVAEGGTNAPAGTETLYFGGGTPSVLPQEMVAKIVAALGPHEYEEFTMEVNPDDIVEKGAEYVKGLLALGVNRVSMGVSRSTTVF